jgi:hypothetical protein
MREGKPPLRSTRAISEVASIGSGPGLARIGVFLCVVLTLAVTMRWLFHDALPGQDHWASLNSSQTYAQRTFPSDEFIGSGHVVEDARLWMPRSATYRVLVGAKYENSAWGWAAPNFLAGFLFPRKRDDVAAKWILCLGCDVGALGTGFHVLSDGGNGVVFGRIGS